MSKKEKDSLSLTKLSYYRIKAWLKAVKYDQKSIINIASDNLICQNDDEIVTNVYKTAVLYGSEEVVKFFSDFLTDGLIIAVSTGNPMIY